MSSASRVQLYLSTWPLVWGWYVDVNLFAPLRIEYIEVKHFELKHFFVGQQVSRGAMGQSSFVCEGKSDYFIGNRPKQH